MATDNKSTTGSGQPVPIKIKSALAFTPNVKKVSQGVVTDTVPALGGSSSSGASAHPINAGSALFFTPNVKKASQLTAPTTFTPMRFTGDFDSDSGSIKSGSDGFKNWDSYLSILSDDTNRSLTQYRASGLESDYLSAQAKVEKYNSELERYNSSLAAYQQSVDDYRKLYAGKLSLQDGDYSTATADDAAYFRDSYQKQLEEKQKELADSQSSLLDDQIRTRMAFMPNGEDAGIISLPISKKTQELEKEIEQLQGTVNYYSDLADRMGADGFEQSRKDWIERGYDIDDQYDRFTESRKKAGTYSYKSERKALENEAKDIHAQLRDLSGGLFKTGHQSGAGQRADNAKKLELRKRLDEIDVELKNLPQTYRTAQDEDAAALADEVYTRLTSGYGGLLAAYGDGEKHDAFIAELESQSRRAAWASYAYRDDSAMAGLTTDSSILDIRDALDADFRAFQSRLVRSAARRTPLARFLSPWSRPLPRSSSAVSLVLQTWSSISGMRPTFISSATR